MSTHALSRPVADRASRASPATLSPHLWWLAGGFAWAFAVPFVLADVLELQRDLFYGVYALAVIGLLAAWSRSTRYDLVGGVRRHAVWSVGLGLAFAGVMAVVAVRSEDATPRPDGIELAGAILWRGVVYGATDGLLLSVFPILAVFAAFAGSRFAARARGKAAVGTLAMAASLAMTAVYHAGYGDFRSEKVAKPLTGDLVWSVPTLVTLNPVGAPIAHAGLHVSAVVHSYRTDLYLPPHE